MKIKRLGKRKFIKTADFVKVNLGDQAIQLITDAMANSSVIRIEYMGSGNREILPYGWSCSKDNNLLIMCYKADSSIRSYRFDRILQLFIDDSLIQAYNQLPEQTEIVNNAPDNYLIPILPDIEQIITITENEQPELPYDEAVDSLEESQDINPDTIINDITPEQLIEDITSFDESEELEEGFDFDLDEITKQQTTEQFINFEEGEDLGDNQSINNNTNNT